MSTENEHGNAESRRQERREHDKEVYHNTEESRLQPDRNDPRGHHDRTRDGDPAQDFSTTGDDGTSDGVSTTVAGSGSNNGGPGGRPGDKTQSPSNDGTLGGGNQSTDQHTPSDKGSHQGKGPRGDKGKGGSMGSRSGKQTS